MRSTMITPSEARTVYTWAAGKTDINKVFQIGDNLKGVGAGKALAIITPSHLMRKIHYQKILNNPNVDTMGVNCCYYMPECNKLTYYLPFTTANKTRSKNNEPQYANWIKNYKGLVMHGMLWNDGTNPHHPYPLATPQEVKEIILKCPDTKFTIWHHSWGNWLAKNGGMYGMLKFPHFDQWTPRKLPWAHCGAVCGFAIPMGMALGYERIYVVGMGYRYVTLGWHNAPKNPKDADQGKVYDAWLQFAPTRMTNQAELAKKHSILLQMGPNKLLEPELRQFYQTFETIEDIK